MKKQFLLGEDQIRRTSSPSPASPPLGKIKSVTSSLGNSSKNSKGSNKWCHECDKKDHNTADCRAIAKFIQQKACFGAKSGPENNSLALLFEEINAFTSQLKPEKTSNRKKRKAGSILSIEINLTTSSDEKNEL
jgi:hypothetical protein